MDVSDEQGDRGTTPLTVLSGAPVRARVLVALALTTAIPILTLLYVHTMYLSGMPADQRGYMPALLLSTAILIVSGGIIIWQLAAEAERANRRWRELSLTDELTGVFNRRYCDLRLREELARAERHGRPFCLVLIDVDNFKAVNDRYGHDMGDAVLREMSRVIQAHSRATTALTRYGGDEFAVLLPETPWSGALVYCDRIRTTVARSPFPHGGTVTISLGVAAYPDDARSVEDLFKVADTSLYAAKAAGRNRVGG